MAHNDLQEVIAFLLGEAALDGVWFDNRHPTERGPFWWRQKLRYALAGEAVSPPDLCAQQAWIEEQLCSARSEWIDFWKDRWEDGDDVPDEDHFVSLWIAERLPEITTLAAREDGWRPIESAPKDGSWMLLWGRYWSDEQGWMRQPMLGQWIAARDRWEVYFTTAFGIRPTVWQPLPAAPPAQGTGEGS